MLKNMLKSLRVNVPSLSRKLSRKPHTSDEHRDFEIQGDYVIMRHRNNICCRKLLLVENISETLADMGVADLLHYLRGYFKTLNLGFPLEIRTYVVPIDKDEYLKVLEKRISTLEIMLESNPSAVNVRKKLQHLRKVRDTIVKDGIPPISMIALLVVEACGEDIKQATEELERRCRIVRNTFSSLGIRVSPVKGIRKHFIRRLFFRCSPWPRGNGIAGLSLKFAGLRTFASAATTLLYPFIISSTALTTTSSKGIYLGKDPDSGERVFWDISKSLSPHVLVVGPTGSGKTEFLAVLVSRLLSFFGKGSIILDIKGEYPLRLERHGVPFKHYVLGEDLELNLNGLSKLYPKRLCSGVLTDVIVKSYELLNKKEMVSAIYRGIEYSLNIGCQDLLDCLRQYVESYEEPYITYAVSRIVSEVKSVSTGSGASLSSLMLEALHGGLREVVVLDESKIASSSRNLVNLAICYMSSAVKASIQASRPSARPFHFKTALVLDEGWLYIQKLTEEVSSLMRLGRSYGVMVCIATQSIDDLRVLGSGVTNNLGLLVAMASPDPGYWESLTGFMHFPLREIQRFTTLLGRGEGIVRISPDPRPRAVSFKS